MRQTGPSLEETVRAKASQWAERGQGADARQPKSEPRSATASQFNERPS